MRAAARVGHSRRRTARPSNPAGGPLAITAQNPASNPDDSSDTVLQFPDNRLLIDLCGELDRNIVQIEARLGVEVRRRGNHLALHGTGDGARGGRAGAAQPLPPPRAGPPGHARRHRRGDPHAARPGRRAARGAARARGPGQLDMFSGEPLEIRTRRKLVEPRTAAQKAYVRNLFRNELVFGLGPAGTGKTYLAVAAAVSMYIEGHVDRIILSPPRGRGRRAARLPARRHEGEGRPLHAAALRRAERLLPAEAGRRS